MNTRAIVETLFAPSILLALLSVACSSSSSDSEVTGGTDDALSTSLPDLETTGGWATCSNGATNCGGAGGAGTPVNTTFKTGSYGGRADDASIAIAGGVSYGTAYWYKKMPAAPYLAASFDYTTDFFIPAGSGYQAIEWDGQQVRSKMIYNFGWQGNPTSKQWRIFNYAAGRWEDSGVPWSDLSENVWHTFHAHFHITGNNVYADWFELDGVRHTTTTNNVHVGVYNASYTSDNVSMGLQLDQNSSGQALAVYYNHVTVTYSDSTTTSSGGSCSAPTILEPTANEDVGPSIQLRTSGPSCLTAVACYIDGDGTPVATATSGAIDQWVNVSMGAHQVQCNGWAGSAVYPSSSTSFTRTY